MFDGLVDALEGAMNTPWIYLAVFAIAAIDAFFPVVP
ncbi:MAG: DedA family protein, partial [Actinobacteria bacterium]|nr:DedA family protein [Actinomycetota bacterium]NIU65042.1 DedA family protein [Actinomycetota bacterium]NIW26841.1 DedA family protein [Actinomycetota bacterium]